MASELESASVDQLSGLGCTVTIVNGQYDQMRLGAVAEASQMPLET